MPVKEDDPLLAGDVLPHVGGYGIPISTCLLQQGCDSGGSQVEPSQDMGEVGCLIVVGDPFERCIVLALDDGQRQYLLPDAGEKGFEPFCHLFSSLVQECRGTVLEVDYALDAAVGQPLPLGDEALGGDGTQKLAGFFLFLLGLGVVDTQPLIEVPPSVDVLDLGALGSVETIDPVRFFSGFFHGLGLPI